MGLVETLLEHVSLKTAPLWLIGAFIGWTVIARLNQHRRINQLGYYAPYVERFDPFGLRVMTRSVKATLAQKNLELFRDDFFSRSPTTWTSEVRILGQRVIWTADPDNIKAILASQFSDYGKGEPFHEEWKDFLGDSIFTTDGHQWHASRQLIRPQFTKDRVSDLHCFESHMETLFRAIANGGPLDGEHQKVDMSVKNKVVEISDLFFRYTLDVTTDFLLGADIKSLSTPKQDFADAFNEVQRVQNLKVRMTKLAPLMPKPTYWAGLDVLNRFVNQYIERALRLTPDELETKTKGEKGYTFLHAISSFTRDRKVLRDQIVAVLLAGRDTTASTLSWTLYEFARNPAVVAKLRAEILDTMGTERTPTYEDMKNMSYLKAVINETLRLYPVVPFNVRLALKDTTLPRGGGPDGDQPVGVTKDTYIGYSTLVMQRRADLYPPISEDFADPTVFSPERWAKWHPKPHHYIPFNSGPRICVGQQFALTEMSYVLCRLLQKYDRITNHMHDVDGGDPMLKAEIVLSPGQGVKISLREAQN